jgi:hypothetical protein
MGLLLMSETIALTYFTRSRRGNNSGIDLTKSSYGIVENKSSDHGNQTVVLSENLTKTSIDILDIGSPLYAKNLSTKN